MTETAHTPLPCPFCGSPAEIEEGSDHHGTWFNLGCSRHWGHVRNPDHTNTCIAGRIYYTETDVPLPEAMTAWNTRPDSHHRLVDALKDVGASLAAAISLLERGGKAAKKAAPSDRMFDQMVKDYKASLERARAALKEAGR